MKREEYFSNLKSAEDALHYGVGHLKGGHSGRYPYGSGKDGKKKEKKTKTKTINKQKIIAKGDVKKGYKYFDQFTYEELQDLEKRGLMKQKLASIDTSSRAYKQTRRYYDSVVDSALKTTDLLLKSKKVAGQASELIKAEKRKRKRKIQ